MSGGAGPTIALLPWGDLIEDFLDNLGLSFEAFRDEMTGGWLFGYIEALKSAGIHTVLYCVSARVQTPLHCVHAPTGADICVLPALGAYRLLRRSMRNPYGWSVEETFGPVHGPRRWALALLRDLSPYLATPVTVLARELKRSGCDAIICQEYEYGRFDVSVLLGRLLKIPVFASFQGGDWQMSRLERWVRPIAIRLCAGLIVASDTEARRVQARYKLAPEKLARVYNPIDLDLWRPGDRDQARIDLAIPAGAQVAVWHGRVVLWTKGLDILIDAWEAVCRERQGCELRLLLIGTGEDAEALRTRITGVPGVTWLDNYITDRALMRRYLSAADVYTLASRHEGFAVAPLEAMACGLPVVAADASGVADMLAAGGVIVPRADSGALAQAMGSLLDDRVRSRRLGQQGRQRVEDYFSLKAVGEQLAAFLKRQGMRDGCIGETRLKPAHEARIPGTE